MKATKLKIASIDRKTLNDFGLIALGFAAFAASCKQSTIVGALFILVALFVFKAEYDNRPRSSKKYPSKITFASLLSSVPLYFIGMIALGAVTFNWIPFK